MEQYSKPDRRYDLKIIMLGEVNVGKSSIVQRFTQQLYSEKYEATVGADISLKRLRWDDNTEVNLRIWDLAGEEKLGTMTQVYYRNADGAFIVYDITRPHTLDAVLKWKAEVDDRTGRKGRTSIPCVLLANKFDIHKIGNLKRRTIQLNDFCENNGFLDWFDTSAKDNWNIEGSFHFLIEAMMDKVEPVIEKGTFGLIEGSEEEIEPDCLCRNMCLC